MFGNKQSLKQLTNLLSIEVSENSVIGTEIHFEKNQIILLNGFRIDVSLFSDLNQAINILRQNIRSLGIRSKQCAIGLSMQYFKLFPVPIPVNIPKEEIESIIIQEGNTDINKDVVVHFPLNNTKRHDLDGVTRCDVLGISLNKNIVDSFKLLAKSCNLQLVFLTPSFFACGSYLDAQVSNNLISSLWISQLKSEFVVWSGQEPIYEHLFLTHQISDQIFQSANYIQSQLAGTNISTILISGPYANDITLPQIPYNVQPLLLSQNIIDKAKVLNKISTSEIVVPLGIGFIAASNILFNYPNLLLSQKRSAPFSSKGLQVVKGFSFKIPFLDKFGDPLVSRFVGISISIILISLFLNLFIQNVLMNSFFSNQSIFDNRISLAQAHLTKALSFEKTNKILGVKVDFFTDLIEKRKQWSKILREIADMTPKGLWIDRLEMKNNNIDVFGRALSVDSVANFSINLNYTAKLLTNAEIITLRKFQEEGIDIVEFQVSARIKDISGSLNSNKETKSKMEKST